MMKPRIRWQLLEFLLFLQAVSFLSSAPFVVDAFSMLRLPSTQTISYYGHHPTQALLDPKFSENNGRNTRLVLSAFDGGDDDGDSLSSTPTTTTATEINVEQVDYDDNDDNTVLQLFQNSERFDRWRFLQELLEGDADKDVVNQLLYLVLQGAIQFPRKDARGDFIALPSKTKESMERILLQTSSSLDNGSRKVVALLEDNDDIIVVQQQQLMLEQLTALLPTIEDDEDAFKSGWDTVMEIHGRESVKYQETQDNTLEWKLLHTVARVLLEYDFLTLGIVTEPIPKRG